MRKARCFIQVIECMEGSLASKKSAIRDWVALLPDPVNFIDVFIEATRFCRQEGIASWEIIHFQKIGTDENDD